MPQLGSETKRPVRIGVVGYGYIGREVVKRVRARPVDFALAFVNCRQRDRAEDIPDVCFLRNLAEFSRYAPDLIIETAHPQISRDYGMGFLSQCDYMPLSTSALIDDDLSETLRATAQNHATRLFLAAGALVGGDELRKRSLPWERARITFRKHPDNIDFSESGLDPRGIREASVVFDGPVREIAAKFPRNVNTMVTAALLSTGLDQCEGVLIADPGLDCAIAEVEAWGIDGSYVRTEKRQPVVGVSGTEMVDSIWYSILRAAGISPGLPDLV